MEVAEQNGGFTACNDEYEGDQEQETEHVVQLMRPASSVRLQTK